MTETNQPIDFPLAAYLDKLVEQLRGHVPAALERWEPDAIHQARVCTRRLKSALDLMKPVLSKEQRKPFADVQRQLRRRLGPLRDLDVMIEHLEEIGKDVKHDPAAQWVVSMLQPQREKVRQETREQKGGAGKVLGRLGAWWGLRQEVYEGHEAIDTLLAESLHAQVDAFAEQAARLARNDPNNKADFQDPHELRITGKALRYTIEMAAEEGHPLPGAIKKAFKRMQESLGLWHDYVVLTERCLQVMLEALLPHHDAAMAGQVLELTKMTLRRADQQLTKFERQWAVAGTRVASCIRDQFPLPVAPAPAAAGDTPSSTDAEAPAKTSTAP